jgi:hypothetical protein
MQKRPHSLRRYSQLGNFVSKLSLLLLNRSSSSSIPAQNDTNNSEVSECAEGADSSPDEGQEQWPPFRPVDLMEFMSIEQSKGALLLFSILTVQSLSTSGWILYRLPWLPKLWHILFLDYTEILLR